MMDMETEAEFQSLLNPESEMETVCDVLEPAVESENSKALVVIVSEVESVELLEQTAELDSDKPEVDPHAPIDPEFIKNNTPTKRKSTSTVWDSIRRTRVALPDRARLHASVHVLCGHTYGSSGWDDVDVLSVVEEQVGGEIRAVDLVLEAKNLEAEFLTVFGKWRKQSIDWAAQFPAADLPSEPDLFHHLLKLPIGQLYNALQETGEYGYLPVMASCSVGQLGALNAESFAERVLSCANQVLHDGNTLLGDEELEMIVVLRMNRHYMEYMRANFNHLSRQQFAMSVARDDDECA
ncbi:hypothetical protein CYMTET_15742 [Cymbomonas tetramitiformis]|uniref:Uncharacterized protein n=1 Tax=Cymbomonas tetramitiformis TaxID=36881 RepID=A0AAE0L902_9CHLO|nr:hypothetical protein CYMTET_15742 [Cymbomonas tetramitiformis]